MLNSPVAIKLTGFIHLKSRSQSGRAPVSFQMKLFAESIAQLIKLLKFSLR